MAPSPSAAGIRSQAGIRLFENTRTAGGLNLYGHQVGALNQIDTMTQLFSHQAAVALSYSLEVTTLKEAVKSRTRIGQAVVMERYRIPEQQAFAFLTRMSQNRNIKVRHIADQLIDAVPAEGIQARPPTPQHRKPGRGPESLTAHPPKYPRRHDSLPADTFR
jgi:hypothetical protein